MEESICDIVKRYHNKMVEKFGSKGISCHGQTIFIDSETEDEYFERDEYLQREVIKVSEIYDYQVTGDDWESVQYRFYE